MARIMHLRHSHPFLIFVFRVYNFFELRCSELLLLEILRLIKFVKRPVVISRWDQLVISTRELKIEEGSALCKYCTVHIHRLTDQYKLQRAALNHLNPKMACYGMK